MMNQYLKRALPSKNRKHSRASTDSTSVDTTSGVRLKNSNNTNYYESSQEVKGEIYEEHQNTIHENAFESFYHSNEESVQAHNNYNVNRTSLVPFDDSSSLMFGYSEGGHDHYTNSRVVNDYELDDVPLNENPLFNSTHNELNTIFDDILVTNSSHSNRNSMIVPAYYGSKILEDDDDDDDDVDEFYSEPHLDNNTYNSIRAPARIGHSAVAATNEHFKNYKFEGETVDSVEATMTPESSNRKKAGSQNVINSSRKHEDKIDRNHDGQISIEERRQRLRNYEQQMRGRHETDNNFVDPIGIHQGQRNCASKLSYQANSSSHSRKSSVFDLEGSEHGNSLLDRILLRTTGISRTRHQEYKHRQPEQENLYNIKTQSEVLGDNHHWLNQPNDIDKYKKKNRNSSNIHQFADSVEGSLPLRSSIVRNDGSQLPSVEEYKTNVSYSNYRSLPYRCKLFKQQHRRRLLYIGSFILFVFVFIVSYTTRKGNQVDVIVPNNINSDDSANSMTTMINTILSAKDSAAGVSAVIQYVVSMGWTDAMSFIDELPNVNENNTMISSHYAAATWVSLSLNEILFSTELSNALSFITSTYVMERYVLAVFYYSTGGPTSWRFKYNFVPPFAQDNVCDWNDIYQSKNSSSNGTSGSTEVSTNTSYQVVGVVCDSSHENAHVTDDMWYSNNTTSYNTSAVTRLYIPSNNMQGTIPSELRLLTNLREINFYNNKIESTVPSQLSELIRLNSLVMFDNKLQGTVPSWLSLMPNLQIVNFGKNKKLNGTIPMNINRSTSLQVINFEKCSIQGDLNPLQGLSSLQALHLASNRISGTFSNDLFDSLTSLIELDLGSNKLTGAPPKRLLSNMNLMIIDIHDNSFYGNISNELDNVSTSSNLRVLSLRKNNFTGPLSPWVYNFNSDVIQHIGVSDNMFTGTVPSEIGALSKLKFLYIAKNRMLQPSRIPTELGRLTMLQDLSLQSSNIIGSIPTELAQLKQLLLFDLSNNTLTGYIPFEFGTGMINLRFMMLNHNKFVGIIPESFRRMSLLDSLLLNNNNFTGTTDPICQPKLSHLRLVKADCKQFATGCPCCTTCCDNEVNTTTGSSNNSNRQLLSPSFAAASLDSTVNQKHRAYCDAIVFFPELDPSAEYNYVRNYYKSRESDVIFPINELLLYNSSVNGTLEANNESSPYVTNGIVGSNITYSTDTSYGPYGTNDASSDINGLPDVDGDLNEPNTGNEYDNDNSDYDDDTTDYDDDYTDDRS